MATTYVYTCDRCFAEHPRSEMRRLGLVAITEGRVTIQNARIEGPPFDLCPACRELPISELVGMLEILKADHEKVQRQGQAIPQGAFQPFEP